MKVLGPRDVVRVPTVQGVCAACGGSLFASIDTFFADTGEPLESGLYVGCVACDAEVGEPTSNLVRQWVIQNFRLDVANNPHKSRNRLK